jgi:hypothetical protein
LEISGGDHEPLKSQRPIKGVVDVGLLHGRMVRLFEGLPVDQERAFQGDSHILEQHNIGNIEAALHEAQVGVMRTPFGGLTDRGPRK